MKARAIGYWVLLAAAVYTGAACILFAVRHPCLTDTERFLRLADALLLRTFAGAC